jgi:transcriptional regulator with XRE-family HTH domain
MERDQSATPLQAARLLLGWKQSRVLTALTTLARQDGIGIAAPASLKTMLSRWENGSCQPDSVYQALLCRIYERDGSDLGFGHSGQVMRGPAPALNPETVDYFTAVFSQHVRADFLMGPHHLVDVVRAQTELLDRILPDARIDSVRTDLLRLACRYSEFTGWLYQDAGEPERAMSFSERAMDYALALDDPTDTVYLLMRKTNIANDQGKPDRAIALSAAAWRQLGRVAPRVRALVLAQEGRALALRGQPDLCARSLDSAMAAVTSAAASSDPIADYCTPEYIAMEAAACWTLLGKSSRAVPIFERALNAWPQEQRRDLGLCQARLAGAYVDQGDLEQATDVAKLAVATLRSATSVRALRELAKVRDKLAPWRRDARVSELTGLIKGLSSAA